MMREERKLLLPLLEIYVIGRFALSTTPSFLKFEIDLVPVEQKGSA